MKLAVALVFALAVVVSASDADDWVRVPGGHSHHKSCVHEVHDGFLVDVDTVPPCKFVKPAAPEIQIYAIDTHWTTTSTVMLQFNASFNTPGNPPKAAGQINYFWPGFKSTQPTMGLPVIQPVLQYGTGNNWVVRSWYVYGDAGESVVSPAVPVTPGDIVSSYMQYNEQTQQWTIFANNTRTGRTTTLNVSRAKVHNIDFKVAMLVLETIMPPNDCKQLPASPASIDFTNVRVNGQIPPWVARTGAKDCGQKVTSIAGERVVFGWNN